MTHGNVRRSRRSQLSLPSPAHQRRPSAICTRDRPFVQRITGHAGTGNTKPATVTTIPTMMSAIMLPTYDWVPVTVGARNVHWPICLSHEVTNDRSDQRTTGPPGSHIRPTCCGS